MMVVRTLAAFALCAGSAACSSTMDAGEFKDQAKEEKALKDIAEDCYLKNLTLFSKKTQDDALYVSSAAYSACEQKFSQQLEITYRLTMRGINISKSEFISLSRRGTIGLGRDAVIQIRAGTQPSGRLSTP